MKRLALALILLFKSPAQGAIAHVQSTANGNDCGTVTTCNLAYGSNVTAGSLLVAALSVGATARTITLSDSLTQTFVLASSGTNVTDGHATYIYYFANTAGGADTVTFSISGAASPLRIGVSEFSGAATASPVEKVNNASGNSTTPASGNVTPTTDGQLIFAVARNAAATTFTAGTDFTLRSQVPAAANTRMASESFIQTTAAAHNGNFTMALSQQWSAVVASFLAATTAVGGVSKAHRMSLYE